MEVEILIPILLPLRAGPQSARVWPLFFLFLSLPPWEKNTWARLVGNAIFTHCWQLYLLYIELFFHLSFTVWDCQICGNFFELWDYSPQKFNTSWAVKKIKLNCFLCGCYKSFLQALVGYAFSIKLFPFASSRHPDKVKIKRIFLWISLVIQVRPQVPRTSNPSRTLMLVMADKESGLTL